MIIGYILLFLTLSLFQSFVKNREDSNNYYVEASGSFSPQSHYCSKHISFRPEKPPYGPETDDSLTLKPEMAVFGPERIDSKREQFFTVQLVVSSYAPSRI